MPLLKEQMLAAALSAANVARSMLGMPPVDHLYPGTVNDPLSCPITNTVYDDDLDREEYDVHTTTGIHIWRKADHVGIIWLGQFPGAIEFINAFDRGQFPELIKEEA